MSGPIDNPDDPDDYWITLYAMVGKRLAFRKDPYTFAQADAVWWACMDLSSDRAKRLVEDKAQFEAFIVELKLTV